MVNTQQMMDSAINEMCRRFFVTREDLASNRMGSRRELAKMRQAVCWVGNKELGLTALQCWTLLGKPENTLPNTFRNLASARMRVASKDSEIFNVCRMILREHVQAKIAAARMEEYA